MRILSRRRAQTMPYSEYLSKALSGELITPHLGPKGNASYTMKSAKRFMPVRINTDCLTKVAKTKWMEVGSTLSYVVSSTLPGRRGRQREEKVSWWHRSLFFA